MVLRGHLDEPQVGVLDRVVRPVMPEPQAPGVGARSPPHDLVAETDPEQRPAVVDDRARQRDLRCEPRRIPRAG